MTHKSLSYRDAHRSVTSTILTEEHAKLKAVAAEHGLAPSAYATKVLRDDLAKKEMA